MHLLYRLLLLFFGLSFGSLSVYAQSENNTLLPLRTSAAEINPQAVDSLQLDSLLKVALAERNAYLFPNPDRENQFYKGRLDSLIVKDGDFMRWIKYVQKLHAGNDKVHDIGRLKIHRQNWVLYSIFVLLFGIGLLRLFFPGDLQLIFQAYYNDRMIQQVSKEDNILTSWPFIFLYVIFSFILGLFICLFFGYIRNELQYLNFQLYLKVSLAVGFLFALKIGFLRFIAFVFEIQKFVREYVTILYLVYFNSLLILVPALLTIAFVSVQQSYYIYYLAIILMCLLFLFRFFKAAINLFGHYKFSIFYLILYLCCLEIAPILILVRLLS